MITQDFFSIVTTNLASYSTNITATIIKLKNFKLKALFSMDKIS
jgi:hypothetical protein